MMSLPRSARVWRRPQWETAYAGQPTFFFAGNQRKVRIGVDVRARFGHIATSDYRDAQRELRKRRRARKRLRGWA